MLGFLFRPQTISDSPTSDKRVRSKSPAEETTGTSTTLTGTSTTEMTGAPGTWNGNGIVGGGAPHHDRLIKDHQEGGQPSTSSRGTTRSLTLPPPSKKGLVSGPEGTGIMAVVSTSSTLTLPLGDQAPSRSPSLQGAAPGTRASPKKSGSSKSSEQTTTRAIKKDGGTTTTSSSTTSARHSGGAAHRREKVSAGPPSSKRKERSKKHRGSSRPLGADVDHHATVTSSSSQDPTGGAPHPWGGDRFSSRASSSHRTSVEKKYHILGLNEFSSERRRMSIVIQSDFRRKATRARPLLEGASPVVVEGARATGVVAGGAGSSSDHGGGTTMLSPSPPPGRGRDGTTRTQSPASNTSPTKRTSPEKLHRWAGGSVLYLKGADSVVIDLLKKKDNMVLNILCRGSSLVLDYECVLNVRRWR